MNRGRDRTRRTGKSGFGVARNLQAAAVIVGMFAVWEAAVRIFDIPEYVLPSPISAVDHLIFRQPDANYDWPLQIRTTALEVGISFFATALAGFAIAIAMSWSKLIRDILLPLFVFVNSLPLIAIAPILLIWVGYGLKLNVLIAFLVSFFPVVINTAAGMEAVDEDLLDLVRYLNASTFQVFVKIRIPNSLPYIFSGLKICSTMCIMGVVVGEFIASDRGLGYIIINSQYTMDIPPVFSSLIVVSLLGAALYGVVALLEKILMPWRRAGE
ncbi:MAG: ABC transporter permease [Planctomycetota bacterium]|jgi:NitT/TauT family transport system permease protein|nr:ABC transporter permease [Planctomycetota bacterium]